MGAMVSGTGFSSFIACLTQATAMLTRGVIDEHYRSTQAYPYQYTLYVT